MAILHCWGVECFKHDLSHFLPVGLWVEWCFGEQHWMFLGGHTQFIVESVVPDLLHIIPIGDDAVLNWIFQGEDTTFGLGLISDVAVLLSHTDHDALMTGTANDGREHGTGCVISGKTGLKIKWKYLNNIFSLLFYSLLKIKVIYKKCYFLMIQFFFFCSYNFTIKE